MFGENVELVRLLQGHLPLAEEVEAIRVRKLRALVHYAYANVPYYHRLFASAWKRRTGSSPKPVPRSIGRVRCADRAHSNSTAPRPHMTDEGPDWTMVVAEAAPPRGDARLDGCRERSAITPLS